jgi:cation transport ATPase
MADADEEKGRRRVGRSKPSGDGKPGGPNKPSGEAKARRSRAPRRAERRMPRLRAGEAIALVAAILLFILMFFDWYGAKATTSAETLSGVVTGSGGGSAWDTLEVIPLFLMLAIVVAVGAAILRLSGSDWKPVIPVAAAVCVLGILAAVLILIRIISPPGPEGTFSELAYESTLKVPVFLALAAALGIAYGGWRAMGEEGTTFASIGKGLESPGRPERPKGAAKPKPAGRSKS